MKKMWAYFTWLTSNSKLNAQVRYKFTFIAINYHYITVRNRMIPSFDWIILFKKREKMMVVTD